MEDKKGLISMPSLEVLPAAMKEEEQDQRLQPKETTKTDQRCSNKELLSAKLSDYKNPAESAAKIKDDKVIDETEPSKPSAPISNLYHKFVSSFDAVLQNIVGEEEAPKKVLSSLDIEGIANYIKEEAPRNVIFMVGAGISTSAGVPDFRSPGTGLYDNLQKFNLPDQQAIFDIAFFKKNPEPFYILSRELFREDINPTCTHFFMRLFEEKGMLRRVFTQNIDTLEHIAGIPEERIVTAHGSFMSSTCQKCKKKYNQQWLSERLKDKDNVVAHCESCSGVVKPDIVFFGERLPNRFFSSVLTDFPKCDLLIIMGSSLIVQPFASLVQQVNRRTPRLLINVTPVGQADLIGFYSKRSDNGPLRYGKGDNDTDVFHQTTCDEGCLKLARLLGWEDELKHLMEKYQQPVTLE